MNFIIMILNLFSMYQVIWTNTTIKIPLGDNTFEYYEMPEAKLYKNGRLVKTEKPFYKKGVNRTSLSVVNSKHVRKFNIDYRVTFKEYNIKNEQTITFDIVDNIAPRVDNIPRFSSGINKKILKDNELLKGLVFTDNYYDNEDIIINIKELDKIDINRVGVYTFKYELTDPSLNTTTVEAIYEIFDGVHPKISLKKNLIIDYGKSFNHYDYFDYEGDKLDISIDDSKVNFNVTGVYKIIVKATNKSNISDTYIGNIEIVDNEKPELVLSSNIKPLEVNQKVNDYMFSEYILILKDNYSKNSNLKITINSDVDTKRVGNYNVFYEVYDEAGNKTVKSLSIKVIDSTKPKVEVIKPLVLNVGVNYVYWNSYFQMTDNYTEAGELTIKYDSSLINYSKLGIYYLKVEVRDNDNNTYKGDYQVIVKDLEAPLVELVNEIYIYDFMKPNNDFYKNHFNITDNYYSFKDIDLIVIDQKIDYNKMGSKEIIFIFKDKSNNETELNIVVNIEDNIPPTIILKSDVLKITLGTNPPNYYNYIDIIIDNYNNISIDSVKITDKVKYKKIGLYLVSYEVYDTSGNLGKTALNVYVDQNIEEVNNKNLIEGFNLTLNINDKWNELDGVTLHSDVVNYEVFYNEFNTSKAALIKILYVAYDLRGNSSSFIQIVEIKGSEDLEQRNITIRIIIPTVIYIISVASIFYYFKKYTN